VADAAHQAYHANQRVPLLLFAPPVSTHSINSTKKKMAFERTFRMCETLAHGTTNQQNKFALAINTRWQNFF
jgi:hypothetical protein